RLDRGGALGIACRADAALRRRDQAALHRRRHALWVEERDQRLADSKLDDGLGGIEFLVGPEGLGRGLDRFLVAGREGAQGVLHAVAELAQYGVGNIERTLGDEIDAHALGPDQPYHLLDLVEQRLGRIVEQQMRLCEFEIQLPRDV